MPISHLIKTGRWSLGPGTSHPDWMWFWRDLVVAVPVLGGEGDAYRTTVYLGPHPKVYEFDDPGLHEVYRSHYGPALYGHGDLTNPATVLNIPATDFDVITEDVSVFCCFELIAHDDLDIYVGATDGSSCNYSFLFAGGNGATGVRWRLPAPATGSAEVTHSTDPQVGGVINYGGTYDGQFIKLYRSGLEVASAGRTGGIRDQDDGLDIWGSSNCAGASDPRIPNGLMLGAYIWRRGLTAGEMEQLASDPFGPFRLYRPIRRIASAMPASGGWRKSAPMRQKPPKWNWSPGLIEPRFRPLLKGLIFATPLWREGLTKIGKNVAGYELGTVIKPAECSWVTGPYGPALNIPTDITLDVPRIEYADCPNLRRASTGVTAAVLFTPRNDFGADFYPGPFSKQQSPSGEPYYSWNIARDGTSGLDFMGQVSINSTRRTTTTVIAPGNGIPILAVVRWQSGAAVDFTLWRMDTGVLVGRQYTTSYTGTIPYGAYRMSIGAGDADSQGGDGDYHAAWLWDHWVDMGLLRQLVADPFGFFRPARRLRTGITLTQEGYRWRDDDADEDEATWLANQDVDIVRDKNVNTRLRTIVDASGNPDDEQYQLEYRKKGDSTWRAVPLE